MHNLSNDIFQYGFGGRKLGSLSPKIKYEVYDGIKVPGIRSVSLKYLQSVI